MPETNGGGRLDRIEALLDKLAERQREFQIIQENDHERFEREFRQHLTWQVLTQEKMDIERQRLDALNEQTDKRIADLVRAIRDLIERIPPENLQKPAS